MQAEQTDPRDALRDCGIHDPSPELVDLAQSALDRAREAIEDAPDVNAGDRAHEIADTLAMRGGLDIIKGSADALDYDSELAAEDSTIRERATTIVYEIASQIAAREIEDIRPDADALEWADARPRPGYVLVGKTEDEGFVYVRIEIRAGDRGPELSIVGDTRDGGGQIDRHLDPNDIEPAPGYTSEDLARLWEVWARWHLNGMNAGCQHQKRIASRMDKSPHEVFATSYDLTHPERERPGYDAMHGKQITRARVVCPICSHNYGSAWLYEAVPAAVLAFVRERFGARDTQD